MQAILADLEKKLRKQQREIARLGKARMDGRGTPRLWMTRTKAALRKANELSAALRILQQKSK